MQAWSAQPIDGTILGVRLPASWRMSVHAGEHERLRFGRFSSIAKSMAFWAFYTGAIASASIASFSIVRGGRDAKPAVAGIQSDASRGTEAIAVPGSMADRPGAIADGMNPKMRFANSDALHLDQILAIGRGRRGCCETVATGRGGCSGNRSRSPPRNGDMQRRTQSATSDRATDRYGGSARPRRGQFRHAGYAIPLSGSGGNTAAFGRGTAAHGREAANCSQGQAKSDRECAGREFVGRVPLTSQHR